MADKQKKDEERKVVREKNEKVVEEQKKDEEREVFREEKKKR